MTTIENFITENKIRLSCLAENLKNVFEDAEQAEDVEKPAEQIEREAQPGKPLQAYFGGYVFWIEKF